MDHLSRFRNRSGLLVSVRNAAEAEFALAGAADVIDIKEPTRGSLGAVDAGTITAIVATVAGRAPISVAAGELLDWPATSSTRFVDAIAGCVAFIKFGLAGCAARSDWPARWQNAVHALEGAVQPVAVAYADWRAARAPTPDDVLAHAQQFGCQALLIDTWSKSVGDLFDRWPADSLAEFADRVRRAGFHLVLAGSLRPTTLAEAVRLRPSLVAVRGAVCEGDRSGTISPSRLIVVRAALDAAQLLVTKRVADPMIGSTPSLSVFK